MESNMQTPQYKKYLAAYKERKDAQDRLEAYRRHLEEVDARKEREASSYLDRTLQLFRR